MPTINLENVSLYYEEQGAGEPLLLLHGLGSNGRSWEYQVEPFARQYRVIVPDVRGHGRSAKPTGPYSVSQFANDIFNLLDHLQIDRFHLVGLSMGGMIGFQMAVDRPERLKSMTIVNSGRTDPPWPQGKMANLAAAAHYPVCVYGKNWGDYWGKAFSRTPSGSLQVAIY